MPRKPSKAPELIDELRSVALSWPVEGRHGEARGADRKSVLAKLRRLEKRGTSAVDGKAATQAAQDHMMRWMTARVPTDAPSIGAFLPREKLIKPWRGKAGRAAHTAQATTRGEQARALHRDHPDLTQEQIAEALQISVRTVRRYLSDR